MLGTADDNDRTDLPAAALSKLDMPDKRLGLLWGDLFRMLAAIEESQDEAASSGSLAELAYRALEYATQLQSELRSRLEMLEYGVGVTYNDAVFPPPITTMTPGAGSRTIPDHLDEIYGRIAALEFHAKLP